MSKTNKNMKKIFIILFISIMGVLSMNADDACFENTSVWKEIICQIKENIRVAHPRAPMARPRLYQSENKVYIISNNTDYADAHLTLSDEQGIVFVDETIPVYAGMENAIDVGRLDSGTYNVRFETESMVLEGSFDVE